MKPISRRTFLRGSGATVGLPLLGAMLPTRLRADDLVASATADGSRPPVRMACIFFPNGVWERDWVPKKAGADYELPFSLAPLAGHKSEILVLSRLDKAASHSGGGHYAKTPNFLTGLPVVKTTGTNLSVGGPSIDQLCAERIGHLTPLPSLELAIDPVASGVDMGYTQLYASYISWRSASMPMAREINPRFVYERLFGQRGGASDARSRQDNLRLLDLVLEDAGDLSRRLGRDDRAKLDEYLDSVRAVEKRIAAHNSAADNGQQRPWRPLTQPEHIPVPAATPPADFAEHIRLMLDLIVLAFWTDATRISTFMMANDISGRNYGSVIDGAEGSHHEFSHHTQKTEKIEAYKKINRWHAGQLAYLLDRLRSIHEGNGTLLDNSMILFGSSISDGDRHNPANLPIILAGRGGHTIATGRHLASPNGTPLCNLYASMLDRMGTPVEQFGDSAGKLLD